MSITHQTVADLRTLVEEVELLRKQRALTDEDIKQAQDYARDVERAAVVTYLLEMAGAAGDRDGFWSGVASGLGYVAQCIERNEHRRVKE